MGTGQGQGGQQGGMNPMAGVPQGGLASLMGGMPPGMGGPMPQPGMMPSQMGGMGGQMPQPGMLQSMMGGQPGGMPPSMGGKPGGMFGGMPPGMGGRPPIRNMGPVMGGMGPRGIASMVKPTRGPV
jgi:translation initiation factor IF-2